VRTRSPASAPRTIAVASRTAVIGAVNGMPQRSWIHTGLLAPRPRIARPPAISSSAAYSMAVTKGWRVNGFTTPTPTRTRPVAVATAPATANAPRSK
jgi:hypothetical protein